MREPHIGTVNDSPPTVLERFQALDVKEQARLVPVIVSLAGRHLQATTPEQHYQPVMGSAAEALLLEAMNVLAHVDLIGS